MVYQRAVPLEDISSTHSSPTTLIPTPPRSAAPESVSPVRRRRLALLVSPVESAPSTNSASYEKLPLLTKQQRKLMQMPTDIVTVNQVMEAMDKQQHTRFYGWIRNALNVDYIVFHLKRVFKDGSAIPPVAMARGLAWMTNEWPIKSVAELLIKMFYAWGVGEPRFAHLIRDTVHEWYRGAALVALAGGTSLDAAAMDARMFELLATVIIGEEPVSAAYFVHHYTSGAATAQVLPDDNVHTPWTALRVVDLVRHLAQRLQWNASYIQDFVMAYTLLLHSLYQLDAMDVRDVRRLFEARQDRTSGVTLMHLSPLSMSADERRLLLSRATDHLRFALTVLAVVKRMSNRVLLPPRLFRLQQERNMLPEKMRIALTVNGESMQKSSPLEQPGHHEHRRLPSANAKPSHAASPRRE